MVPFVVVTKSECFVGQMIPETSGVNITDCPTNELGCSLYNPFSQAILNKQQAVPSTRARLGLSVIALFLYKASQSYG